MAVSGDIIILPNGGGGAGGGDMLGSNNLSELTNTATARTNIGLGSVNNTSDLGKPISTATQLALDDKASTASVAAKQATLVSGTNIKTINSTTLLGSGDLVIDKSSVGLGSVENTAFSTWTGTTNITTLGTITTGTWNGTAIATSKGGTGQTSLSATNNASELVQRDSNKLAYASNFVNGFTTTATAAGTTTLTVASNQIQEFTGTTTQTIKLPATTTLSVGTQYRIINNSTGTLTIQSNGAGAINTLTTGVNGLYTCINAGADGASSWDYQVATTTSGGGLTNFTESNNTYSSVTAVKLLATNAATNVPFVIEPKGNAGLYLGAYADGTTTGGNNRGTYAVDLQMQRTSSPNVASGNYSFVAGYDNTASAAHATAIGRANVVSARASGIGFTNTASGVDSLAAGASNTASSLYAVAIGKSNTAQTGQSAVAIGESNTSSGNTSVAIGNGNSSSGAYSLSLGRANTASNSLSANLGGWTNTTSSAYSTTIGGYQLLSNKYNQVSGGFSNRGLGYNQYSTLTMYGDSTSSSNTELFLDNSSARVTLVDNQAYAFQITALSHATANYAKTCRLVRTGVIYRTTNASSTAISTVSTLGTDVATSSNLGAITLTADTTNGSLKVELNSGETATLNWTIKIELVEVLN